MDTHDTGRGRGGWENALKCITQPVLVVSVSSDILYPVDEQLKLAKALPNATYFVTQSDSGHDGFLLDQEQILPVGLSFIDKYVKVRNGSDATDKIRIAKASL